MILRRSMLLNSSFQKGGTLIIKLFLDIDQDEQEKRFKKLEKKKETQWRVTQGDKERNVKYDEYALMAEEMLFLYGYGLCAVDNYRSD